MAMPDCGIGVGLIAIKIAHDPSFVMSSKDVTGGFSAAVYAATEPIPDHHG
jgi:hypothetical protein